MRFHRSSSSDPVAFRNDQNPAAPPHAAAAFADCLLGADSGIRRRGGRSKGKALAFSALTQVCIVCALVIVPLFASTQIVRRKFEVIPPYAGSPAPRRPSRPISLQRPIPSGDFPARPTQIFPPTRNPQHISEGDAARPPSDVFSAAATANGGSSFPGGEGVIPILGDSSGPVPPRPGPTAAPKPHAPVAISQGVQLAMLVHRVEPVYPVLARQTRTEGTVQLHAIIARDGTIEHLEVINGPLLLIQAAKDAVLQWRFRPTLLNGEAVEVDTYITVIFHMQRQ